METKLQILPLGLADLDTVVALDNAVFDPSARDDREVYEDRLILYPGGCFKLIADGEGEDKIEKYSIVELKLK